MKQMQTVSAVSKSLGISSRMLRYYEQITALSTIKSILSRFVHELHEKANLRLQLDYLGDRSVFAFVDSIAFPNNRLREDTSMDELSKANEALSKLEDKDVRIVYLPPMTVAAAYASGQFEWGVGPEATSKIKSFVWETGLLQIKPDARGMGFNCSSENRKFELGATATAYEAWVSIPEDIEIKAPLVKRTFSGGMYAAHVL